MSGDRDRVTSVPRDILVAGGGIAGLELALALADLGHGEFQITMMAPEPEFEFKPLSVEEPFTGQPAERHELASALAEFGGEFILGALSAVDVEAHTVTHGYSATRSYDALAVCIGGRARPAYDGVATFWSDRSIAIDELIERAAGSDAGELNFIVPPKTSWSLPLYEIALMARRRTEELGCSDLKIQLITPEDAPLGVFGTVASGALAETLAARRIEVRTGTYVTQPEPGGALHTAPGDRPLDPALAVALPQISGIPITGVPADDDGFIPIDEHGRVEGVDDVYAAGDGTNFPVKQGGLATQQADAVAEHIAMRAGQLAEAKPFDPVLRGQLLTGMESLHMKHDLAGGHGEGAASLDALWWPPQKVAGRYLAPWLGHTSPTDLEPPSQPIEVVVSWPHGLHGAPLALDVDPGI